MPATFHVENFGCRAARADGEAIAARLRAAGYMAAQPAEADVVVVNTCSVTAEADREARALIRRLARRNPQVRILATGCYAQRAPQELAGLPGVAAVIGNSHKGLVPGLALDLLQPSNSLVQIQPAPGVAELRAPAAPPVVLADDAFAHSYIEEAAPTPGQQTRPNLKIQEGCSNRCSFCVIRQTRGSSRSLAPQTILSHVRAFVAAGGQELVLSGINLGRWGRDLAHVSGRSPSPEPGTLAALVRHLLAETTLPLLRLSSIEPMDWDAELVALFAEHASASGSGRMAPHAHLPLQSGSDAVLRRMHRRYRPWHYAQKVASLLAACPDLTVGADVMAGFPGETDREFEETLEMLRALPFAYLHLFPFSPRPATRAWDLHAAAPVPPAAVAERMAALRSLAAEKTLTHRRRFLGRTLPAITLHTPPALAARGRTAALTHNFLPVELEGVYPANLLLRICPRALRADATLAASPAAPVSAAAPAFMPHSSSVLQAVAL